MTVVAVEPEAEPAWEPSRDLATIRGHLAVAVPALARRTRRINLLWRYHDGDHPQLWMTQKFRRLFGRTFESSLGDNYCELAVQAPLFRMAVTGWAKPTEGTPDAAVAGAAAQWEANELDIEQEELYRAVMVAGEAYLIAWPRTDENGQQVRSEAGVPLYDVVLQDARNVYLRTGTTRRDRRWAAKVWWEEDERRWRATLYYGDELVRLRAPVHNGATSRPACPKADMFELDPDDPGGENPAGKVLVFRFARDKRGRSRLHSLLPVQDKINKLAANKMVAAEFLAWRQRVIMTTEDIPDDKLRPEPGAVLLIDPGGDTEDGNAPATRVYEWAATELDNYDKGKQAEVDTFFTLALLPRHLMVNPGTSPSGDAVRADEGPFVSMILDMTTMMTASWRDLMTDLGYPAVPTWAEVESANGEALAREVQFLVNAGVPVEVAMEQVAGWDEERMKKLRAAMADQARRNAEAGAAALAAFDQGASADELADRVPTTDGDDTAGGGDAEGARSNVVAEVTSMSLDKRIELAVRLVQYGWEPASVEAALRLPTGLVHSGALPVTVRPEEEVAADVAATRADAAPVGG